MHINELLWGYFSIFSFQIKGLSHCLSSLIGIEKIYGIVYTWLVLVLMSIVGSCLKRISNITLDSVERQAGPVKEHIALLNQEGIVSLVLKLHNNPDLVMDYLWGLGCHALLILYRMTQVMTTWLIMWIKMNVLMSMLASLVFGSNPYLLNICYQWMTYLLLSLSWYVSSVFLNQDNVSFGYALAMLLIGPLCFRDLCTILKLSALSSHIPFSIDLLSQWDYLAWFRLFFCMLLMFWWHLLHLLIYNNRQQISYYTEKALGVLFYLKYLFLLIGMGDWTSNMFSTHINCSRDVASLKLAIGNVNSFLKEYWLVILCVLGGKEDLFNRSIKNDFSIYPNISYDSLYRLVAGVLLFVLSHFHGLYVNCLFYLIHMLEYWYQRSIAKNLDNLGLADIVPMNNVSWIYRGLYVTFRSIVMSYIGLAGTSYISYHNSFVINSWTFWQVCALVYFALVKLNILSPDSDLQSRIIQTDNDMGGLQDLFTGLSGDILESKFKNLWEGMSRVNFNKDNKSAFEEKDIYGTILKEDRANTQDTEKENDEQPSGKE